MNEMCEFVLKKSWGPDMAVNMDLERMQESANEACRLLKTLGNSDRLLLLCQISQSEKCVGSLECLRNTSTHAFSAINCITQ